MEWFERAKLLMGQKGVKNTDIAQAIGESDVNISRAVNGNRFSDSISYAFRISQALGVSLEYLLTGREPEKLETDFHLVPWLKDRPSGGTNGLVEYGTLESGQHLAFRKDWLNRKYGKNNVRAFQVQGNSMAHLIQDGDVILVDITKTRLEDSRSGKIYVIAVGDTLMVKRLAKNEFGWQALSDNDQVVNPPIKIDGADGDVKLAGKVVWIGHEVW